MKKLRRCKVCKERPQIARGMCKKCYGRWYYKENKDKFSEYYKQYSKDPRIQKKLKMRRMRWYYERGGKEVQKRYRERPDVIAKKKKYMEEYNQRPYVKKKKKEAYLRRKNG